MERFGVAVLTRLDRDLPDVEAEDAVHVLNPNERRALARIQRGAIARAAAAGAISAGVAAALDLFWLQKTGITPESDAMTYWGLLAAISGVTAFVEIAYLYFDALRSVLSLSRTAGLNIFSSDIEARRAVARALARAALELPNPPHRAFGVDPRRELSRTRLILVTLLYKAKIGLTNFLLKAVLRRAIGRAAVRAWLVFVAVPVSTLR